MSTSQVFTDMLNRKVILSHPVKRIVSLVPSQTELLYDLGLDEEVIGITKFCVHPRHWFETKKRIGGTKTVNLNAIADLKPDLIIANKEENVQEQVEYLAARYPTWVSDIHTLNDALQMIKQLGQLTNRQLQAEQLANKISAGFARLPHTGPKKAVYFIWRNPWMCAGGDTFINDMMTRAGLINVLAPQPRYPEVTLESLKEKEVDIILLSSEPYPFKDKHIAEINAILPSVKVMLVDGEMFSWYGSRLQYTSSYLEELLHQA